MAMHFGDAFRRLVESGYIVDNGAGWHYVAKVPTKRDLAWYVAAIAKLGAYSVPLHDMPSPIEMSTGSKSDEVLFRMRILK